MTVLEYDCIQDQFPNPMTPTAQGVHEFKLDAKHNYPMGGMDISDTDGDGEIDMIAVVDGITGNISYADEGPEANGIHKTMFLWATTKEHQSP